MVRVESKEYNSHTIATAFCDAGGKDIVVFCHGYRGTSVGPSRFFVRAADKLAEHGISSFRFDQYGSGNSDGDFYDSSFSDWVATTKAITQDYAERGYKIVLFGQSMGGATVIVTGSDMPEVAAVVAWVPDPNVDEFSQPESAYIEEGGQRVQPSYWQEAHDAGVAGKLSGLKAPAFIVQCTDDEYVDEANRRAISSNAQPNHQVLNFDGYKHSSWTYDQADNIITKSVDFIVASLKG